MRRLSGAGVVGGIASGQAVLLVRRGRALRVPVADARIADEVSRLERARERSRQQIAAIRARLSTGPGAELAPLFDAQLLMLDDPLLVGRARTLIGDEKVNAEWAVQRAFDEVAALFDDIDDPYLRDRRGDVADVAGRVRMNLRDGTRGWQDVLDRGEGPFVLVADDPPPSVAAQVDWSRVTGLAIDAGSRTSHTAILARSLGIPTVVGLGEATLHVKPGMSVIVDGLLGELIVEPSAAFAEELRARVDRQPTPTPAPAPRGPALTRDGTRIRLDANVDRVEDVAVARREHADGIGLFRSELLLNGDGLPGLTGPESERAQADIYRHAILTMAPRPVTIRTFDLDEGQATSGRASVDAGPELDRHRVLGLRGVRLGMSQPALLDTQLRAILRAAATGGAVRILVPFVTAPFEMKYVAARLELARQALATEGLQLPAVTLGAMIEVPAAALAADHLSEVSAFLAVGTNDLVQYLLAADRTDQRLAALVSGVHPALLRLLRLLPRLAARHAVPVSVCGELASQPTMLALLMGLGVREFSMTPAALGTARRVVESSDLAVLRRIARRAARTGLLAELEHHVEHALVQTATPSEPVAKP
jgi:phosphoenolpyruvate-protein phosphotransferase (PTS system enzyme I)